MKFTKAHAYGNDFIYVLASDTGGALDALARDLCDRHTGIGGDGLIVYTPTAPAPGSRTGASMRLLNADGSASEVSGNGVRGLAAILLRDDPRPDAAATIDTVAGAKHLQRTARDGARDVFRASMGLPRDIRQLDLPVAGETIRIVALDIGNPQCLVLGPLPDDERFARIGAALERHPAFPEGTNVEFVHVESPDRVAIRIWERGVGPTLSSGTGSCASLVAAASYAGARRDATVVAPGGTQRVEWRDDNVYLTGWAEILFDGVWRRANSSR